VAKRRKRLVKVKLVRKRSPSPAQVAARKAGALRLAAARLAKGKISVSVVKGTVVPVVDRPKRAFVKRSRPRIRTKNSVRITQGVPVRTFRVTPSNSGLF